MTRFRVACVQMRSGIDPERNTAEASRLIREAVDSGAQLVATPEMTNCLDIRGAARDRIVSETEDSSLAALRALAGELGIWLVIGSLSVNAEGDARRVNRSLLISPEGRIAARYDKIHMFDVELGDGQVYRESAAYRPGHEAVLADTPLARIGLTICYDVRFGRLYRTLAQAGAELITCPAAFTRVTGEAHWHVLLRARAIETGSYLIAPAQGGLHEDGRETFGHSLIVSPWGEVLAEAGGIEPGWISAEIDTAAVAEARRRIPSLALEADFLPGTPQS